MPDPSLLTDALAGIDQPTETALALPHPFYSSPAVLDLEREVLFRDGWLLAGATGQIPDIGDAVPLTLLGEDIVLIRSSADVVRCFRNICRHRSARLLDAPAKNLKLFVCPYHAWAYTPDGRLKTAPRFLAEEAPPIDRDAFSLCNLPVSVWQGLIFVNLSGKGSTFEDFIGPFDRWVRYPTSEFRYERTLRFTLRANWKLAIENFIEAYHVPTVHRLLNSYSPMTNRYSIVEPDILGQGSVYTRSPAGLDDVDLPVLSGGSRDFSESPSLMPNLMLSYHDNFLYTFSVEPLAPDLTEETFHFFFVGDESLEPRFAEARDRIVDRIRLINNEDIEIVENVHRGRSSPANPPGRFSPVLETTTHAFQRRIARRLAEANGAN